MGDDLYRVESAVRATASGNLTDGNWPHDVSTALGLSGRRNPLGFAVVRFLSGSPTSMDVWEIVLLLATDMMRSSAIGQDDAREAAWTALEWWRDSRCQTCGGRGVVDTAVRRTCPACNGTGKRKMPVRPEAVREAITLLISAEAWMEGQLAARLKGQNYAPSEPGYKVTLPPLSGAQDGGFNSRPDSAARFDSD